VSYVKMSGTKWLVMQYRMPEKGNCIHIAVKT